MSDKRNQEQFDTTDMQELAVLWTKAQSTVSAFVSSFIHNSHNAEDIIQQIAAAAAKNFHRYDRNKSFNAWALGIARHKLTDYLRQSGRDRHMYNSEVVAEIAIAFEQIESESAARKNALQSCLKKINQRARRLLDLHYVQGQKAIAIGQLLSMTDNAVWAALHRSRDALAKCIQKTLAKEEDA